MCVCAWVGGCVGVCVRGSSVSLALFILLLFAAFIFFRFSDESYSH